MVKKRHKIENTNVKVLCTMCSEFFDTSKKCLECSNWNVCILCLRKKSNETIAILRNRGITINEMPL